MDGEKRKAVIYARVASAAGVPAEDRAFTIAGQEKSCRAYAKEKGYQVVAKFTDVGPGNEASRPGFKAMLAFLREQREPHIVLVQDPSRIARSVETMTRLRRAIGKTGAVVDSPVFWLDSHRERKEIRIRNEQERER